MEDSSMINMPDLVFDDKVGNKRVRDGEEEIHKGRLEKRPSGIFATNGVGDHVVDDIDQGGESGGIIDSFISNVFHKNTSGTQGEVNTSVLDAVEDEVKREDLGRVDGGDGGGEGGKGGGGIISAFFTNIFHQNGSEDEDGDRPKSDHLLDEEKTECLGGGDGENRVDDGEPKDLNGEKLHEKKDEAIDMPSKDPTGPTKSSKPDDYAERVFFLNNN